MEDKMFELMTKMYTEFTKKFETLETGQNQITQRLGSVENRLGKLETTLEHDIKTNIQALHDGFKQNTDTLAAHTGRLETIESKIDVLVLSVNSQDKRLSIVENLKKKAK